MAVNFDEIEPRDLVIIDWVDSAAGDPGWEDTRVEKLPPVYCKTAGFVWDIGDDYITLVPTISNTQVLGRLTIPKVSILLCQKNVVGE